MTQAAICVRELRWHWNERFQYFYDNFFGRTVILAFNEVGEIEEYVGNVGESYQDFLTRMIRTHLHIDHATHLFVETINEKSRLCRI